MKSTVIRFMLLFSLMLVSACGGTGPLHISWLDNAPDIVEESREK